LSDALDRGSLNTTAIVGDDQDVATAIRRASQVSRAQNAELAKTSLGGIPRDVENAGCRPDAEFLRDCAWDVAEKKPAEAYRPAANHVGLAMVTPARGIAHWRILDDWIGRAAQERGDAWHDCRFILRLYDVSYIEFDGLNANGIQDHDLPATCGHIYFSPPHGGAWQLAEVGFLLRSGEFVPAARSQAVPFAPGAASSRYAHGAILVDQNRRIEEIGNVWDQETILKERRTPKLRTPLRIGVFAFPGPDAGDQPVPAKFVSELASGLCEHGHEVHVFVADLGGGGSPSPKSSANCHTLDVSPHGTPLMVARNFARAAEQRLVDLPPLDLIHLSEWMTGTGSWVDDYPTVLSLGSLESTRRNGAPAGDLSREIEAAERSVAGKCDCVLVPHWLENTARAELEVDGRRIKPFAMEGRPPDEWGCPLDEGQVKAGIGAGPLDRLILFMGPLEHAAGVDLIIEALPVLLQRWPNLRVAFAGTGDSYGHLAHRAGQLGVDYAVRLLGHVDGSFVPKLMRSAEALVLPSRYRVPFDDAVVELARRAGRPVITTHGGPAHLVQHEETGVITYDNPGSVVWAMDRILGDPAHAQRMAENGRRCDGFVLNWNDVSRSYLELCAAFFPQLTQSRERTPEGTAAALDSDN